uniref:RNA polymerase sigma factor 70 region 4 type 2 domain-containing protein n=1 Tax=Thermosporothrix sp. COM3 TaxID=2490863 RepID=A0A455SSA9_9CHLR|nr:hypothetical protein KTC_37960 [Thermosporothrix sp. COM3]
MSYLPVSGRTCLELYYLQGKPLEELAESLRVSVQTLKVQMHRLRRQLWRLFNTELRTEAEELGLAVQSAEAMGRQKTCIWCVYCGRHYLVGTLQPEQNGTGVYLYCPECSPRPEGELLMSGGTIQKASRCSFLPAYKRDGSKLEKCAANGIQDVLLLWRSGTRPSVSGSIARGKDPDVDLWRVP